MLEMLAAELPKLVSVTVAVDPKTLELTPTGLLKLSAVEEPNTSPTAFGAILARNAGYTFAGAGTVTGKLVSPLFEIRLPVRVIFPAESTPIRGR
jgi:hypothetical protein